MLCDPPSAIPSIFRVLGHQHSAVEKGRVQLFLELTHTSSRATPGRLSGARKEEFEASRGLKYGVQTGQYSTLLHALNGIVS